MTDSEKKAYRDLIGLKDFEAPKAPTVVSAETRTPAPIPLKVVDINPLLKLVTLTIYFGAFLLFMCLLRCI